MRPFSFPVRKPSWSGLRLAVAGSVAALLVGCAAWPQKPLPVARYDFGLDAQPVSTDAMRGSTRILVLGPVKASGMPDFSTSILYRLAYANDQELRPYTQARWNTPATQLIAQRVRSALSRGRPVLMDADGAMQALLPDGLPSMLRLEVEEFSQVFDAADRSQGVLRLRATLTELTPKGEKWLGQQMFQVVKPSKTPDAAGGSAALAAATADAAQQLDAWLRQQGR